uniref:Dipeptidylpeptidase IV N-terminal domain-containing protein n=1 Tax=candidate division WOR-3 bacterium TaxID=2052148 RepID=A0A7V0Z4W3_UNCW3
MFTYNKDGNNDLWLINKDGSGLTQLTKTPYHENAPVWSPDGKKIAFLSNKDGEWALYVMDAPALKLPPRQDVLIVEDISVSSEIAVIKEKLFYLAPRSRNQSNEEIKTALCMYDMKKKVESVLTNETENIRDFVVAPSGDRIAFRLENNSVRVINSDGKERVKIATENFYNELGLFTPDGKQFIFVSARPDDDGDGEMTYLDKLGIYSVNTDGKDLRQLEPPEFWTKILDISKDGSMILFSNKIDEIYRLYLFDMKNNKKIKIAENCAFGRFLMGDKKIYFTKEIPTDDGWLTESYVSDIDGANAQKFDRQPIYSDNGKKDNIEF